MNCCIKPPGLRCWSNPDNAQSQSAIAEVQTAASTLGAQFEIVTVTTNRDIDLAAVVQKRPDGLLISPDPLFTNRLVQLATLSARHVMPTIYSLREFAEVGGLMTYGSNFSVSSSRQLYRPCAQWREAGRTADPAADQV